MNKNHKVHVRKIVHPGCHIRNALDYLQMSRVELCRRTGFARSVVYRICEGQAPITPDKALVFERVFTNIGIFADALVRDQAAWDLDQARKRRDMK